MHKKIKEAAGMFKKNSNNVLYNEDDNVILELKDRLEECKKFLTKLFDNKQTSEIMTIEEPQITREEVSKAIRSSKNKKVLEPDKIQSKKQAVIMVNGTICNVRMTLSS